MVAGNIFLYCFVLDGRFRGSREKVTVDELARKMCSAMGVSPELAHIPPPGGAEGGWAGDVRLMLLDSTKLERLGWKPEVGMDEGLRRYLRWLAESARL